jgi:hypothetical protein
MPTKLTSEIITAAIVGFEEQKRQIDVKIAELRTMLTGGPTEVAVTPEAPATRKRRKMSAAGRKAIAEAQRKRWAASKKAAAPDPNKVSKVPAKRRMTAARKAALVANLAKARAARAAKRAAQA